MHLKAYLFLIIFVVVYFRKVVLGFIPIPFDLLVQWFFPYNAGGWQIQGHLTQYKGGHFASDAIRELYPWRHLAVDLLHGGELPLWNPYAFSGSPLMANLQTAVWYPLNIVFFVLPSFPWAWAAYIVSATLMASLLMFIFLRSLRLRPLSALLGSLAFAASGYMTVWLEWGVIVHVLAWLPLSLFAIKRWWESQRLRFLLVLIISTSLTILAGYPQGAAMNFTIVASFLVFLSLSANTKKRPALVKPLIVSAILTLGVTALQWLPAAELFLLSAMRGEASQRLSKEAALPVPQLVTLLAPDYFGNRVTDDYWARESFSGVDYMDADLYLGATTFLLAMLAIRGRGQFKERGWLISLLGLGILLGTKSPVTAAIADLGIPVISTGAATDALILAIFSLTCLGAFGLEQLVAKLDRRAVFEAILIVLGLFALLAGASFWLDPEKARLARSSLVVPASAFGIGAALLVLVIRSKRKTVIASLLIVILAVELLWHADKILPFASPALAFPKHTLIEELRSRAGYFRIDGFWESEIATNFHTAFRLYSAEGYDPLYIRRYGEFVTAAETGRLPSLVPRSDADITQKNEANRNRLLDLTSVKYIAAKVTDPNQVWEEEPLKYDPTRFKLVWQKDWFKIYENLHALPRVKLFTEWEVIKDDAQIIERLYNPLYYPQQRVILEEDPGIEEPGVGEGYAQIVSYQPTRLELEVESENPAILLLTDSYYPGWKATINGKATDILRANYTFRGVIVPEGRSRIVFDYQPISFKVGLGLSMGSLLILTLYLARMKKEKS